MSQDNFLFSGSVADNQLVGSATASDAEIEDAAHRAHAHDFIAALPKGYQTAIGKRGVLQSGGQQQRLNLARTLLRDPAILILDEPTGLLDAESESIIRESMGKLFSNKTRIIIAH